MRKTICILLAACILFSLTACTDISKSNKEFFIIQKNIGDEIHLETYDLKVISTDETQSISSYYGSSSKAVEDCVFVIVGVQVTNKTDNAFNYEPDLLLKDNNGREYESYSNTINNIDNYLENRKLSPGFTETGYLVFEILKNSRSYSIFLWKGNELYEIKLK